MKRLDIIQRVALLVALPIVMQSCSNDFIELPPQSTVSIDVLYKTDKDFQDAVVSCYRTMQQQYQSFWIFGDVRGDDSEQQVVKNDAWYLSDAFILESDNNLIRDTWRNYYRLINRANTILERIEEADPSVVTNKDRHIGESRFLRALAYFDLVRIFGPVPIVTRPITPEEAYQMSREDVERIYNEVIIPDLLDAENKLPTQYTGANIGRATSGAAKSMLGKVYLTIHDFASAESKLQEVTTMGYALLEDYNALFDYSNEHHSEYIFDIEYQEGLGDQGSVFTNRFMPISGLMNEFYGVTGVGVETNSPSEELMALFEDHDARKDITVAIRGGFINDEGEFVAFPQATSQTYTKKYLTPVAMNNDSRANWKVTRYADVLLMYAEALNENNKTTDALIYLNQIRERAGVAAYSGLSQDEARERISDERRLELSFEGHRWFDLVRTGRAFEVMEPFGMNEYMTVFPVPLEQIQIINNQEIFPQNPGYN
ncbi:RagB/SusD family nutrient uptake outer membrane protein [Parapedobacter koreensis]|uniref:Starch-binding associating with outer membrane n=1 Tax=Parapedobacter koreensis TaxID=332977 RepID=A0A1H7UI76_9SPHI|nr:RagB/SusD family nutrient uptake outer membrane protein [Parapedobacter koreensis]SEL96733.1 Starch-binding associating with outer membrane [Parapedobacter koreensis]